MKSKAWLYGAALTLAVLSANAGTFGQRVPIGGHAADLALDETRGVVYVANFTANRVDVVPVGATEVQTSIPVASPPSGVALSPNGAYLVITHYANFEAPVPSANAFTVVHLDSGDRRSYALEYPPLAVAFGADHRALIVTTKDFQLFDPSWGFTAVIETIDSLHAKLLPQPAPAFPPEITTASMAASRDGRYIFGLTDNVRFGYDVWAQRLQANEYTSSPKMGPRAVSVSDDGARFTAGWALFEGSSGFDGRFWLLSQFPNPAGDLELGSHVIDSARGLIYAQIPAGTAATTEEPAVPVLQVVDADNLRVFERIQLPENLAGKSVLSSDGSTMYAVSDSGILILPVGELNSFRRLRASVPDLVFRGNFCDRGAATQEFTVEDASGAATPFTLTSSHPGVRLSQTSATTPATIKVTVDPAAFQNHNGTVTARIDITSPRAVNLPDPVRVLVNNRGPEQRGVFTAVPGRLVDIVADPIRDRFYIVRQDTNEVLVFDSNTHEQIAAWETGNTPTQVAISSDARHLIAGADNSQVIYLYDLETLQPEEPIHAIPGHYPRSIAVAGSTVLIANRVAGTPHVIDRLDLEQRTVSTLNTLGIYKNDIDANSSMAAAPNGSAILVAQANGTLMVYSTETASFTVARQDNTTASGALAASNYGQFVVGNQLLNASLVPIAEFGSGNGLSTGFAFLDQGGFRLSAADASSAGVLQKVDPDNGVGIRPTHTVEAPLQTDATLTFPRTLALLANGNLAALTTSGFTIFPADYDRAFSPPRIDSVASLGDGGTVGAGGLVKVSGINLSAMNLSAPGFPYSTVLGETCMSVNGTPAALAMVSPRQVNAQLPAGVTGNVTVVLRAPGGVSNTYRVTVAPSAPSIFRSTVADTSVATVVRAANGLVVTPSNPVHRGDSLSIFATGLGETNPPVAPGEAAPADPPAVVQVTPTVKLGGVDLPVVWAGLVAGQVGVYEIRVNVGGNVPTGWSVPLEIQQNTAVTSVDVRVVR